LFWCISGIDPHAMQKLMMIVMQISRATAFINQLFKRSDGKMTDGYHSLGHIY
jgi:hypothetical protein